MNFKFIHLLIVRRFALSNKSFVLDFYSNEIEGNKYILELEKILNESHIYHRMAQHKYFTLDNRIERKVRLIIEFDKGQDALIFKLKFAEFFI